MFTTFLGCYNDRGNQIKKLAKSAAVRLATEYKSKGKSGWKTRSNSYGNKNAKRGRQNAMYKGFRGAMDIKPKKSKRKANRKISKEEEEKSEISEDKSFQRKHKKKVTRRNAQTTNYNSRKSKRTHEAYP